MTNLLIKVWGNGDFISPIDVHPYLKGFFLLPAALSSANAPTRITFITTMSSIASCTLRTASRHAAASTSACGSLRAVPRAVLVATRSKAASRRAYVTETKQDQARVETAIKLDKKDFADIPPPSMGAPTDAKVRPMAGKDPNEMRSSYMLLRPEH